MTDATTLQELLRRVEGAAGADRELDEQIAIRVAGLTPTIWLGHELTGDLRQVPAIFPKYTASLDAATDLAKRVLPTIPRSGPYGPWEWEVHGPNRNDAGSCRAKLKWPQTEAGAHIWTLGPAYGKTPALALIAALLSALIAQANAPQESA